MLRLIVQSALAGLLCVLATAGLAQEIRETWVFGRDGVQFDFRGGCADHDAAALWLFVRVRGPDNTADTVELWFVDISPDGPSERLRVVSEEPAPHAFPVGCVVANGTKLAWRLVDRGKLLLHRLSLDGLEPIGKELGGRWEYPVMAVALHQGAVTFVATDAVGIVDVETGTVGHHERWTAAAWIEPGTGELYSVRSMQTFDDADGFPPVALAREAVLPDGGLRLLASTEPWPAMQPVEEGAVDEIGPVDYQLAAMGDEVVLLRSHFLGAGRLQLTAWDKTLRNNRTFAVDMHDTPRRSGVFDSISVGGQVVVAVPKYSGERVPVRLLYIDPTGVVREYSPPQSSDASLQNIRLFNLRGSIYAVASQWAPANSSRPVTVDVFAVQPAL